MSFFLFKISIKYYHISHYKYVFFVIMYKIILVLLVDIHFLDRRSGVVVLGFLVENYF